MNHRIIERLKSPWKQRNKETRSQAFSKLEIDLTLNEVTEPHGTSLAKEYSSHLCRSERLKNNDCRVTRIPGSQPDTRYFNCSWASVDLDLRNQLARCLSHDNRSSNFRSKWIRGFLPRRGSRELLSRKDGEPDDPADLWGKNSPRPVNLPWNIA